MNAMTDMRPSTGWAPQLADTFEVRIDVTQVPEEERQAHVIRLLRGIVDRMERGSTFGGFPKKDKTKGGFSYRRKQ